MKISTILDLIDSGYIALPEFQRGYVWNRDQVKGLFDSLYRRHPVGGLLVWVTESQIATHRGNSQLAPGMVKLLLDGQQRITSLYGALRGTPPKFFDGEWYFAVEDVISVLIDSTDIKQYIKKLRKRDSELSSNWGTICTPPSTYC